MLIKNIIKAIGTTVIGIVVVALGGLSCSALYFKFGWTGNVKMGTFAIAIASMAIHGKLIEDFEYEVDKYFYEKQKESR